VDDEMYPEICVQSRSSMQQRMVLSTICCIMLILAQVLPRHILKDLFFFLVYLLGSSCLTPYLSPILVHESSHFSEK